MSFFGELIRRNVFRVGAAYMAVSWLVIQVIETLFPVFGLSYAAIRIVIILLAIGFLPAVVFSWTFQLTPGGLKRDGAAREYVPDPNTVRLLDRAIMTVLAIGISYFAFDKFVLAPERAADRETEVAEKAKVEAISEYYGDRSIAVLPFLNLSRIGEQEHFADGLTEELLNSLAALDGLRVISRTSSHAFKGSSLSTTEIAEQLNVGYILEGSVRRTGNMVRVTAQLIDADSDSHLWSRNYENILGAENLFKVQESIARQVADSLQVRLTTKNAPKAPTSIGTLDLYYDGLAIFRELQNGQDISDEKFSRAAEKFEAAIQAEPAWLPAFVKLGQLYHWWSFGGTNKEKLQTSRRYITEALRRDPQNADASWSLAYILWAEGEFEGSLEAYDRARELGGIRGWGPSFPLSAMGRFDEAVTVYREAVPLYPLSTPLKSQLLVAMYCAGQYSAIVSDEEDLIASWPDQDWIKSFLAVSHARLGNREKALAYVDELAQGLHTDADFAVILAAVGESERALRAIDELIERDQGLRAAATAALMLGDQDRALDLLEHLEQQSPAGHTNFLFCEPEIRALAGNPRYDTMLKIRGLLPD